MMSCVPKQERVLLRVEMMNQILHWMLDTTWYTETFQHINIGDLKLVQFIIHFPLLVVTLALQLNSNHWVSGTFWLHKNRCSLFTNLHVFHVFLKYKIVQFCICCCLHQVPQSSLDEIGWQHNCYVSSDRFPAAPIFSTTVVRQIYLRSHLYPRAGQIYG